MLVLSFSSKLDQDPYIVFIAKTGPKKIEALIRSSCFLLRLLLISINLPSGLAWNTFAMSGQVCKTVTWIY